MQDTRTSAGRDQLVAFFRNRDDAMTAISDLKNSGFTSNQIGLAMSGRRDLSASSGRNLSSTQTSSASGMNRTAANARDDRGMWDKIRDFFTGEDPNYEGESYGGEDYERTFGHLTLSDEQNRYYHSGITAGGAIITVSAPADRLVIARRILEDNDGDLRSAGFGSAERSVTDTGAGVGQGEQRIQLRGELLRAVKERVQKGEIRLRKHVVTENQTMNVPVTREEVIVERVPASGTAPTSAAIGDQGEVRIPVSEERVRVSKEPVVTGEVRVQKRQIQDTQQVSGEVRHEEVDVENQGDVSVNDKTRTTKKKPAA